LERKVGRLGKPSLPETWGDMKPGTYILPIRRPVSSETRSQRLPQHLSILEDGDNFSA
jgi:hypothetical protein